MGNSFSTTPVSSPANGNYTNQLSLEQRFGAENIRIWSNTDNTDLPTNESSVQYALTLADDEINQSFLNGPYIVPLSQITPIIAEWANILTAFYLYTARGILDKGDEMGGKLTELRSNAMNQMAAYKGGAFQLPCARRWPTPTAPIGVSV